METGHQKTGEKQNGPLECGNRSLEIGRQAERSTGTVDHRISDGGRWLLEKFSGKEKRSPKGNQSRKRSIGDSRSLVENNFRYSSVKNNLSSDTI